MVKTARAPLERPFTGMPIQAGCPVALGAQGVAAFWKNAEVLRNSV